MVRHIASFRLDSDLGGRIVSYGKKVWKIFSLQTPYRMVLRSTAGTFTEGRGKMQHILTAI
jgi:hypothetical protein